MELLLNFAFDSSLRPYMMEGSLRHPAGKAGVPVSGLVFSLREIWEAVKAGAYTRSQLSST